MLDKKFLDRTFERRLSDSLDGKKIHQRHDGAFNVEFKKAETTPGGLYWSVPSSDGSIGRIQRLVQSVMLRYPVPKPRGKFDGDLYELWARGKAIKKIDDAYIGLSLRQGLVEDLQEAWEEALELTMHGLKDWLPQRDKPMEEQSITNVEMWALWRDLVYLGQMARSFRSNSTVVMRDKVYELSTPKHGDFLSALWRITNNTMHPRHVNVGKRGFLATMSALRDMFFMGGNSGQDMDDETDNSNTDIPMWFDVLEPMRPNPAILRKRRRVTSWCGGKLQSARLFSVKTGGDASSLYKRKVVTKGQGGAVLIDGSGSMCISEQEMRQLVDLAPAASVAYYSSGKPRHVTKSVYGTLTIVAREGLMYTGDLPRYGGGNDVDLYALKWLLAQRATPLVYVTDEQFCGGHPGQSEMAHTLLDAMKAAGRVRVVESVGDAIALFKRLQNKQSLDVGVRA